MASARAPTEHFAFASTSTDVLKTYSCNELWSDQRPTLRYILYRIKSDMDEPNGKLMGTHGYCTQEMVSLLLSGRAVSNVFNDTVTLDGPPGEKATVLHGVTKRGDVGLLSLFEHYKSCQVRFG